MMRRRSSPRATRESESVTASRCQFDRKGTPGRTTPKANSVNDIKCSDSMARKRTCWGGSANEAASSGVSMVHLFRFLILGVVVQQLRRSKYRRTLRDLVLLFFAPVVQHRLILCGERFFAAILARHQLYPELVSQPEDVASRVAVTLGVLGHQLLNASRSHRHDALLLALPQSNFLVQRVLRQCLEVHGNRPGLPFGALRLATLPRFALMFLRRTTGPDLVFLVGRLGFHRGCGIGPAVVGIFLHFGPPQAAGLARRRSSTVSKVSPDAARTADLPA